MGCSHFHCLHEDRVLDDRSLENHVFLMVEIFTVTPKNLIKFLRSPPKDEGEYKWNMIKYSSRCDNHIQAKGTC